LEPLNLTIRPVSGPSSPPTVAFGAGRPPGYCGPIRKGTRHEPASEPPLQTTPSFTVVVRFPECITAA
jgi:hypothetical protein